jgi:selenocysteine lyase/cysteine desulfurase
MTVPASANAPAQANVSGVKYDRGWVKEAADRCWSTLLDAAAFAPTNRLDLKAYRSGCFRSPGIDEIKNGILGETPTDYFATEDGGDYHEKSARLGKMRGATRVSLGVATSLRDVNTFTSLLRTWLIQAIKVKNL